MADSELKVDLTKPLYIRSADDWQLMLAGFACGRTGLEMRFTNKAPIGPKVEFVKPPVKNCVHARLILQSVEPTPKAGTIGTWYACLNCGQTFDAGLKPHELKVSRGRKAGI